MNPAAPTRGKIVRDLNSGGVTKTLVLFALPFLLSSILQMMYTTTDMMVVGHFVGKAGLNAVEIGGEVMHFFLFVSMGLSNAGQVTIAQFLGAGFKDKVGQTIGTLFTSLAICSLAVTAFCLIWCRDLVGWMNTPPQAVKDTYTYIYMRCFGLFFVYAGAAASAVLRAMGDSKHPFIFILISTVSNIILDLLFVLVFHWGVYGVALATVISEALNFLVVLYFLHRHRVEIGITMTFKTFRINGEVLGPIIKLGLPMTMQSAFISLSMIFVKYFINGYGMDVVAATGIGHKLCMVVNMINFSIASAATPMVGQAIGAENYQRVPKVLGIATLINAVVSMFMVAALIFAPLTMFAIFTTDETIIAKLYEYIPVMFVIIGGGVTRPPMNSLINGSGNFKLNLTVGILDGIIARVGLAILLGITLDYGLHGFWYGHALAGFVPGLVGFCYLLSGKWRTRKYIVGKSKK